MGWSGGSRLADEVWEAVRRHLEPTKRQKIARKIVDLFEHEDADDWDPERGVYKAAYPKGRDEDEEDGT